MSRIIDKDPCLVKARDEEPAFIILGRDPAAFATLETWCEERWRLIHTGLLPDNEQECEHIAEAQRIMEAMREYQPKSFGKVSEEGIF
jgi:hypothetical protein